MVSDISLEKKNNKADKEWISITGVLTKRTCICNLIFYFFAIQADENDDDNDGDYLAPKTSPSKRQKRRSVKAPETPESALTQPQQRLPDKEPPNSSILTAAASVDFQTSTTNEAVGTDNIKKELSPTTTVVPKDTSLAKTTTTTTGRLPCICEFCGRAFKAKLNLRTHVRNVHARIRKFKCDQCEKDFVTGYLLAEHSKAEHEGMPSHLCPICGRGRRGICLSGVCNSNLMKLYRLRAGNLAPIK